MQRNNNKKTINSNRGVLHNSKSQLNYSLQRVAVQEKLSVFIDQYWFVEWNLIDKKNHTQQNLPDPAIHITIENGSILLYGPIKQRFTQVLSGRGCIFGIKFQIGGFYPISKQIQSQLCDQVINLNNYFNDLNIELLHKIEVTPNLQQKAQLANTFFEQLFDPQSVLYIEDLAHATTQINKVKEIVSIIKTQHNITKVNTLCDHLNINSRSLQRLCNQMIGLSPKWLIRKFRMHEVLARLEHQPISTINWQDYVNDLEYLDQAHFIHDFKSFTGYTPQTYLKQNTGREKLRKTP